MFSVVSVPDPAPPAPAVQVPTSPPRLIQTSNLYYEARTVGKRAVCILLECFLVSNCERRSTCGVLQVNYRQLEK